MINMNEFVFKISKLNLYSLVEIKSFCWYAHTKTNTITIVDFNFEYIIYSNMCSFNLK
jgi:hypothetical protein